MANYTLPVSLYHTANIRFDMDEFSVRDSASAFNPVQRSTGPISEFWLCELTFEAMLPENWRPLSALLRKLRGQRNKIRIYDKSRRDLQGAGGITSTVNVKTAALAGATSITLKNMLPNETQSLMADDHFGIGENLYAVSEDAASNSSGEVTINFLPPLRQGVAANDPVNLSEPTGLFVVVSESRSPLVNRPSVSDPLTITLMEDPDFGY